MAISRSVFFPHLPFLAVSKETHHYKGFLPEIFHGKPIIRKAAHVYRRALIRHADTLLCHMAISDLQGAVGNQIKYVIGDIITSIVFNRALCQLLRQSFNKNLANLVGRGSI
uniref:Uncharacterized protein n=1 Tax=Aotus nancymaae TaxID=37293 RepID=A0A2K5DIV9_AOTNA